MRHITGSRARLGAVVVTPLLAVLLLGGCAAGMSSAQPDIALEPAVGGQTEQFVAEDMSVVDPAMVSADRSVITTGWATVLVEQPADAANAAISIVEAAGGRIDGRSESAPTEYSSGSASLTLRIPSDRLTEVLDELKALGDVQNVSLQASDVTLQVTDLDARIEAMRASIERLSELVAQATDIDALISLETAISDRQAQLESMLAEQRWLDDQVTMSTIQFEFVSEQVAPEPEPNTFFDGLAAGWDAFVAFGAGLLVALGFVIPWLVMFAIIGLVVLVIVRVLVGRANRRAATAQSPITPTPVTTSEPTPPAVPAHEE